MIKKSHSVLLYIFILLVSIISTNRIMKKVPVIKDDVTFTALDVMDKQSSSVEIVIKHILVEGNQADFEPKEGKWFWRGNDYIWRNEADERKPDGITGSVTISLPVGRERSIVFLTNRTSGMVQISGFTNQTTVNLYSESEAVIDVEIPDSNNNDLSKRNLVYLSCFLLIASLLIVPVSYVIRNYKRHPENTKARFSRNCFLLALGGISFITLAVMVSVSGKQGFWLDEMYQLGYIHKGLSLQDTLKIYATMEEVSPPLFGVVSYIWYRIVPNGQRWLLLICEIPIALSVFLLGLTAGKLRGERYGILAAIICATSRVYLYEAGQEFRMYGFLIFFSTLTLCLYIRRVKQMGNESRGSIILYGISLALVVFSHYIAAVVCLALFVSDIYLYVKKKIKLRCIYSYIIAFLLLLPWAVMVLFMNQRDIGTFWPEKPRLLSILNVFKFLLSHHEYLIMLFFIGVAAIIYLVFNSFRLKRFHYEKHFVFANLLWVTVFTIATIYGYSKYIAPSGSLFVLRYFICIAPYFILICAYAVDSICRYLDANQTSSAAGAVACIFIILLTSFNGYYDIVINTDNQKQSYRAAAEWLIKQDDIYSPKNVVFLNDPSTITAGWKEFYVEQGGRRDSFGIINPDDNSTTVFRKKSNPTDYLISQGTYKKIYFVNLNNRSVPDFLDKYKISQEIPHLSITVYVRK